MKTSPLRQPKCDQTAKEGANLLLKLLLPVSDLKGEYQVRNDYLTYVKHHEALEVARSLECLERIQY